MKPTPNLPVEKYRITQGKLASSRYDGNNGAFYVPNPRGPMGLHGRAMSLLVAIVSDGMGWDHVSVRVNEQGKSRTPTWDEMCYVKDLFFDAEECVLQFHPPRSQYVNFHEHVLHLWRPQDETIRLPNPHLVDPKQGETIEQVQRVYADA